MGPTTHHAAVMNKPNKNPLSITEIPSSFQSQSNLSPDQVLIKVAYAGVNQIDYKLQDYDFLNISYPAIPGLDISGVIVSVGKNVTTLQPGNRVIALSIATMTGDFSDAAFQTYAKCRTDTITMIPDGLPFGKAAVLPLGFVTAAAALFDKQGLGLQMDGKQEGALVVWGGSSSLGSSAIQLAANMGLTVYATASPRNFEYCKSLGASEVFDYSAGDVVEQVVKAASAGGKNLKLVGVFDVMSTQATTKKTSEIVSRLGGGNLIMTEPAPEDLPSGVEAKYITAESFPLENKDLFRKLWKEYMPNALADGKLHAKPDPIMVKGGVEKAQEAMNLLKKGVSAKKVALEIDGSL